MTFSPAQRRWGAYALAAAIVALGFGIRLNNLFRYTTWWADDGGGHIAYVETVLAGRLPVPAETYLAWHEPLYYVFVALWHKAGALVGLGGLDWWEATNVLFSLGLFAAASLVAWLLTRSRAVALAVLALVAVQFPAVKLAAYVNNELLAQTFLLLAIAAFVGWRLGEREVPARRIVLFGALLGVALVTKITAVIALLAALLVWGWRLLAARDARFLARIAVVLALAALIQAPWLVHKVRTFGTLASINLYETLPRYRPWDSPGWRYVFAWNNRILTDYPYWYSLPQSGPAVLLADSFGDYYNLFGNVDRVNALPEAERTLTGNGRYTTPALWRALLAANRIGLGIAAVWAIGLVGYLVDLARKRRLDPQTAFVLLALVGGGAALLANNLRLPYLDRGVLKAHFIYFTYPLLATLAWGWLRERLPSAAWALVVLAPLAAYVVVAWPMLAVPGA